MKSKGAKSHLLLPSCLSNEITSNWNTILNSFLFGELYNLAISGVAPHVSPTVNESYPPKVLLFISCKYSCNLGPFLVISLSTSLPIKSITSNLNPPTPSSNQKLIISYIFSLTKGFSQFKSGCLLSCKWK